METKKKESIVRDFINCTLILVICVVQGCFDWMRWEFHPERLVTAVFWIKTVSKFITLALTKEVAMNMFENIKRAKNENLAVNKKKYERLNKLKQNDFSLWVELNLNPKIKKEAYVSKINRKVNRLESFTNPRYRLLWALEEKEREAVIDSYKKPRWKRRAIGYLHKKGILVNLKSDEFIEKNLNALRVRCANVNPSVFDLDIHAKQKVNSYQVVAHNSLARMGVLATSTVFMVLTNMIFSIILFDPNGQEALNQAEAFWNAFINMLIDFVTIGWQFYQGTVDIGEIINSQECVAYANRNAILEEYLINTGKVEDNNKLSRLLNLINESKPTVE